MLPLASRPVVDGHVHAKLEGIPDCRSRQRLLRYAALPGTAVVRIAVDHAVRLEHPRGSGAGWWIPEYVARLEQLVGALHASQTPAQSLGQLDEGKRKLSRAGFTR